MCVYVWFDQFHSSIETKSVSQKLYCEITTHNIVNKKPKKKKNKIRLHGVCVLFFLFNFISEFVAHNNSYGNNHHH